MLKFKQIIAYFFIVVLAAVQLSELHSLSHDDEAVDCEVCVVLQSTTSDDFLIQPSFQVDFDSSLEEIIESDSFYFAFAKAHSFQAIFTTRPPPSILV